VAHAFRCLQHDPAVSAVCLPCPTLEATPYFSPCDEEAVAIKERYQYTIKTCKPRRANMQTPDLKKIAQLALENGDIDTNTFWRAAQQALQDPQITPSALFGAHVPPERLRALLLLLAQETKRNLESSIETIADPFIVLDAEISLTPQTGVQRLKANLEMASPDSNRYRLGDVLGQGGAGAVYRAKDMMLLRSVALKTIRRDVAQDEDTQVRFLSEAHITAKLEHPNVIPVYDLGVLPDSSTFYTMRIVTQRSLRQVFSSPAPRADWPLARLCVVFVQVCRAMHYAHSQGVVHRDLKPENILLGEYGEVYVADWGIAKRLKEKEKSSEVRDFTDAEGEGSLDMHTRIGVTLGTPGYMSPEQIKGDWEHFDHRGDLFSLGVILYELLTGQKPFQGKNVIATLYATLDDEPISPRELNPSCPILLQELCLSLLHKDQEKRPKDAALIAASIESYLEGEHEKFLRKQEAEKLRAKGKERLEQYYQYQDDYLRLESHAATLLREIPPWRDVEHKLPAWEAEEEANRAFGMKICALAEATELYLQALGYDPGYFTAKQELADIYLIHAKQFEALRNKHAQRYYEDCAMSSDSSKIDYLNAAARVSLDTQPSSAQVTIYRYEEQRRVLRLTQGQPLGATPLTEISLPQGSYLALIEHPSFATVRYPFVCHRSEHHHASLQLYTQQELGEGFVLVPRGEAMIGGDSESFTPLPRRQQWVDDFAIAKHPVTFREYFAFINELHQRSPGEARRRLPREASSERPCAELNAQGVWVPVVPSFLLGGTRPFTPESDMGPLPVFGVDWFDAVAYCKWKSAGLTEGRYRLPTEVEWEKAIRGADGRFFPWGDQFDATFCKMNESRVGDAYLEPSGSFPIDEGPYGAQDMAGGIRSWVADIDNRLSIEEALATPEPSTPGASPSSRVTRGGAWWNQEVFSRAGTRTQLASTLRFINLGFRLVRELAKK
jgi:eukaryotic-like serine/threonine-protein kinase